jgi:hypothetical protein
MRLTEDQYRELMASRGLAANSLGTHSTPAKKPKYGNRKVTDAEGNVHDSTKEYRRWCDLELRQRSGEISDLRRQVVFDLIVNDLLVCRFVADATYRDATGAQVVEDTKSQITRKNRAYRIKVKLMRACHGIDVQEV